MEYSIVGSKNSAAITDDVGDDNILGWGLLHVVKQRAS